MDLLHIYSTYVLQNIVITVSEYKNIHISEWISIILRLVKRTTPHILVLLGPYVYIRTKNLRIIIVNKKIVGIQAPICIWRKTGKFGLQNLDFRIC